MKYLTAIIFLFSWQAAISLAQTRDMNLGADPYFQCPAGTSIAPHPERCDQYYTCYGGQPVYRWQCSNNLLFDLTYNGCNWPEQVYCGNRTVPGASTVAPYICPQDGFFATDSSQCVQKYYTCLDGTAFATLCPSYGVFEPTRKICVSPSTSSCESLNANTTTTYATPTVTRTGTYVDSSAASTTSTAASYSPTQTVKPTIAFTTSAPGVFTCPAANGSYPDPNNCSFYYTCDNGTAYHFACPGGLVFNPTSKVCDWPQNVPGC